MYLKGKKELLINPLPHHEKSKFTTSPKKDQVFLKNDINSVEDFYEKYSLGIYTRFMTLFKNEDIAKKAIPHILLKGYVHLFDTDLSNQEQFINFLTYQLCMDIAQDAKARRNVPIFSAPTSSHEYPIEELLEQEISPLDSKQLEEILSEIPLGDKAMLLMKYQDDMSIEQIAKIVDLDIEEVKIKLVNAQYIAMELKSNLLFQG